MKLCTSMYIIVYIYIDMKSTSRILIYACICIDVFACISYHLWQIVIWTDALAMNISSKTPRFLRYIQNHKVIQRPHSPNIYIYIRNVGNAQNIAFPRSQKMPTSKTMMAHQILKVICFPKPSRQRKTTNRHCNSKLVSNSLFSWLLVTLVTCPIMDVYLDCFPGLYVARNETQVIFSPNKLCFTADMGM